MIKKTLHNYLVVSAIMLAGMLVNLSTMAQTILPDPIHHLSFQEGGGNTVTDTISSLQLNGVGTTINWAQDDIKNYPDTWFVKSGANFNGQGVVQGTLIQEDLNQYTFTFLTRITDSGSGAIFRSLTDSMHFRFWNGTWDIAGAVSADPSYVKYNTWVRVSYVQTATDRLIYIDGQLAGQATGVGTLRAGDIRLGGYNIDSYFYPGEYTDVKIFDQALTAGQIASLVNEDGVEGEFSSLTSGSDLGGVWKREEHDGQYNTIITSENGMLKHWFNGDSCWGAVSKLIPLGNDNLWFSAEFYYPSVLTANHDFGTTAQTIGIYEDFGRSNPIAILYLDHDETSNVLTLGSIIYRNTSNGITTVPLDGRVIQKDMFHQFELNYVQGTNGTVAFYLNGEELLNVTDTFDIEVQQAMYGFNLGIHPETPGDYIYSRNIYAGVQRGTTQVTVPDPVYYLPLQEGSGTSVADSVTGLQLSGVDTAINWAQDDIKNRQNTSFIKSGVNFGSQGVVQGTLIQENLDEYTFTFLTRITDDGSGAIFRSLTNSLHFRFWYGTWDFAGGLSADPNYVKYNTWVRVTYVQSSTERMIYIDNQLAGQSSETGTLYAGDIRLGAYNTDGYFYPGEYTDIKIYDQALSAEQIASLVNEDGVEGEFSSLTSGSDLGGVWKREEHGGQYDTVITSENGMLKHWFNGDSCWGAVSKLIPSGNSNLWFSAEFYYPSELTANHDFGTTAQTIAIYEDLGRSNPIAILYLDHDEITNVLTLGRISYRNTASGLTTVYLDGRVIQKDTFHQFELNYVQGTNGTVAFYLNGEELLNVTDDFDLVAIQAMYGFNLGIHPEVPGDFIYSRNIYAGVQRLITASSLPEPVYFLPLQEGSGTTVTDSITSLQLTGVDTAINWAQDNIKNRQNASFIKSGVNFGSQGVVQGTLIQENLDEYTFTFLTRITDDGSGAIFRSLTNGMHFRFWDGTWDIAGSVSADPNYVKYNTWVRVTYVQSATDRMIYIDNQLAGQSSETGTLYAGDIRLGAYNTDGYFYPGEYTDIKIYDQALSAEQIASLVNEDGVEGEFSSLTSGSDLGGVWKREEHGGQYDTVITSENGMLKHWFNGDSCWGAVSKLIPSNNNSLWFSAEFYYPSELTANHDFGTTAQTIAIYQDLGRSNPIAILYLDHDEITNVLTLGRISYRNTASGLTTVYLDDRVIQKDTFHQFELNYVQGTNGTVAFYLNGEELLNVTDDFDLVAIQAMYGFNLGIHPEVPGDFIYSRNIYAGVQRGPARVTVPDPVYYLPLQEGSGTAVTDSVTGLQLSGVDTMINWVQGDIKGVADKWYVKSGASSGSQGIIQGTLIQNDLTEYTFSFLTRINEAGSGAIFRSLTDGLHFRFWYGTWDIAGSISADSAYVQTDTWVRVSYVQSATDRQIYIDEQLAATGSGSGVLSAGDILLGAYTTSSYHYPGEYTEIKIFDQALNTEQIALLVQDDINE